MRCWEGLNSWKFWERGWSKIDFFSDFLSYPRQPEAWEGGNRIAKWFRRCIWDLIISRERRFHSALSSKVLRWPSNVTISDVAFEIWSSQENVGSIPLSAAKYWDDVEKKLYQMSQQCEKAFVSVQKAVQTFEYSLNIRYLNVVWTSDIQM